MKQIKTLRPYQQECLDKIKHRLKKTTEPLLVNASVGAGKSLIIAELLHIIEKANWHALCLTMNSTLIQQNYETYKSQEGSAGIYCAGLNEKNTDAHVIFGSPHSVAVGIKENSSVAEIPFNLIVVDEAHNINPYQKDSMYVRILNHYGFKAQENNYSFRVIGLTGTPYRGKAESIVGEKQYFKEEVCSVSTSWLIEKKYLVAPTFGMIHTDSFDMSHLRVDKMGKFKHKELQSAIDEKERLTAQIMRELIGVIESGRNGAFIFASTIKHAQECIKSLPIHQSALISADTSHQERKNIISKARCGEIKYLVNVATLLVGVDVPNFDVCAWLRPTESLALYTQGIGRVLRIHAAKKDALILDYARNLERHGDVDDPLINAAILPKFSDDPDYCIKCYACNTLNKDTARRCIGTINKKRCDHFFTFIECPNKECSVKNDITARHCRLCESEIIDPNKKLTRNQNLITLDVFGAKYWVSSQSNSQYPVINAQYQTNAGEVYEGYYTSSDRAKNMFYGRFVRLHFDKSSDYWPYLNKKDKMIAMIGDPSLKTPIKITCRIEKEQYNIVRKLFI